MTGHDLANSLNTDQGGEQKSKRKKHHFHATTKSKVPVEVIQEIRNAEVRGEKRSEVKKRYPELDANAFTRIWDGITAAHIIGKVGN